MALRDVSGHSGDGSIVGLDDLRGLFQPECFYDSKSSACKCPKHKAVLSSTLGEEVCYPRLGCFSNDPPWSGIPGRLLTGLPEPPEEMNISFSLYTRETGNNSQVTFIS